MNIYSSLLYKRGFLFTDIKNPVFYDDDSQAIFNGWSCLNIGNYRLFYDPVQLIGSDTTDENMVVILGMALNPFDGIDDSNEIARKLLDCKNVSEIKFLEYLNQLSGRFLVISKRSENIEIFNDACGTRTVFYDKYDMQTMVSSHATLIANLMNYQISDEANYFFYNKNYKKTLMKKLPGIMSPYEGVYILTPNTKLKLPERRIERIFPYKENPTVENYDELEKEVAELMRLQINMLNARTKIAMSLTAGMDSRVTLAATRELSGEIVYFTYLTKNERHILDVKTAKEICDDFHLIHRVYEWDKSFAAGQEDFKYIWLKNLGIERGIMWLNKIYADSYPKDRIHIRSNIAEIAKADSNVFKSGNLSDRQLAFIYTTTPMNKDEKVIRKFSEFMRTADFNEKSLLNYDYRDMFEWEFNMCQWHSWILMESDMSHDTFLIYNNREILRKMLSLPYNERLNKKIFIGIIKRLWPELLDYPVNGKMVETV
jgi:hypothetical protein